MFSYDVGHASIGWGVVRSDQNPQNDPEIVDCGVVLFQKDSCLASKRRQYRRSRRNIRATRQRIARIKALFAGKGILPADEMTDAGHMAPFFLAARCLVKGEKLSALELWHVLRWYAHNRGYDGNSRWSKEIPDDEDTEKMKAAVHLMELHDTSSMAETVTSMLGLDLSDGQARFHVGTPAYLTANAAFPRRVVHAEVERILRAHSGIVKGLDDEAVGLILTQDDLTREQRQTLKDMGIKYLPKRYCGGLLFGQLVPRFDNRIISKCPIAWAKVYDEAVEQGLGEREAAKKADKFSKVPLASSREFLRYRLARVIANIREDGKPLSPEARRQLFALAEERGSLSKKDIQAVIREYAGEVENNVRNYFELHPDSEKALVLDPALELDRKAREVSQNRLYPFYSLFPSELTSFCISAWRKGKAVTLNRCLAKMEQFGDDTAQLRQTMDEVVKTSQKGKKKAYESVEELGDIVFQADYPTGRAPYSRPVLEQVVNEVLAGYDPSSPARSPQAPNGENKEKDGVLYPLMDPASRVNLLLRNRSMDELTNNHLVRHRMLILSRLVDEMVEKYADGEPSKVNRVLVEVGRDVSLFSGKTAKEIQAELNYRLRDFKSAVSYLEKHAPDLKLTGGLIRKCRIAMDMKWKCPFTSYEYNPYELSELEREHIVPYSNVKTNALHALVLTFPEVNRMKGKRTAYQFIQECANMTVEGKTNLSILTPNIYKKLVDGLDTKGHRDDMRRKRDRKTLLMLDKMSPENEKEQDFTMGQMTQSSHLMKLAARVLNLALPDAVVSHIPGAVNGLVRKSWNTLHCLKAVAPDITDGDNGEIKSKDEIRGITHMHHALDALNLAVAWHYIPGFDNGRLWRFLMSRNNNEEDRKKAQTYKLVKSNNDGAPLLMDIPKHVKDEISRCLLRERVMQHIPADRSGALTDETTWRILKIEGEGEGRGVYLKQRFVEMKDGKRNRIVKKHHQNPLKINKVLGALLHQDKSKLNKIKGGIVVRDNFGIALEPMPRMIVHHNVHSQLEEIKKRNGGRMPRIIRPYSLIKLSGQGERDGVWIVRSLKDDNRAGLLFDLTRPSYTEVGGKNKKLWRNVRAKSLLKKGLEILPQSYLGYSQTEPIE